MTADNIRATYEFNKNLHSYVIVPLTSFRVIHSTLTLLTKNVYGYIFYA